jgi:hypothetical protein
MRSSVLMNTKNGRFEMKALPAEAQFTVLYGITAGDYDGDGKMDLLVAGNFYQSKPETGISDAGYGLLLKGDGNGGFTSIKEQQSGVLVKGAVRNIMQLTAGGKKLTVFALNNEAPVIFNSKK